MKTMLLVDGNSILNRAFYGIRPLTNSAGLYTQAVYGMMNILLRHLEERKPDYAAVAFDRKAPTFRHLRYDGYKATRKGMPPELAVQFPYAKKAVAALGFVTLETDGYEADDILGTCSTLGGEDTEVYILTGDRDALQLIRDRVTVLLASTGETAVMDRAAFTGQKGVSPEQYVDVKALMGDSSDNIPGVPGIGEKTAFRLIAEYGSLDHLYGSLPGTLTGALLRKLEEGKDSAYLSQFLSAIDCRVPLGITKEELGYHGFRRAELTALLTELELTSLIKRLGLDKPSVPDPSPAGEAPTVESPAAASAFLPDADRPVTVSDAFGREPVAAVLSGEDGLDLFDGSRSAALRGTEEIARFLSDPGRTLIVRDGKALCLAFGRPACRIFDVSLAAYVNDPSDSGYDLPRLAVRYLGKVLPDGYDEGKVLFALAGVLKEKLKETGQETLCDQIEVPLSAVLADMEKRGFQIDRAGLSAFTEELGRMVGEYAETIYFEAGREFNINSPKQLGEVLFGELGLPTARKTKTGYSTDAETLEKLRPYHSIVDRILEYRQVAKLRSTYGEGLLKVADENGRIHSSFNQTVTATGRLSSSEPNLQNIPIRTELGRRMRQFFIPRSPDYLLVDADYSQIELRLLAAISGDLNLVNAFLSGQDIHTITASQVFGVPPEAVTPDLRKRAKAVNFGIIYGIGGFSLGADLHVPTYEADRYIKSYLARYPQVSEYLSTVVEEAAKRGYVTTIFGRRRYIPELSSPKKNVQAFGRRVAMNSPIQGAAADIIKIAMIRVDRALRESGLDAALILQVHDELILEAHRSCAAEAAALLKREMESAVSLAVPLTVEVGIGDNWLDCK